MLEETTYLKQPASQNLLLFLCFEAVNGILHL